MAHSSQHRVETRECPGCGREKTYPARNRFCSISCGNRQRALKDNAKAASGEGFECSGENATLTRISKARITTLRQLLDLCEVDESEWAVERWVCNKWDQAAIPRATGKGRDWERPSTDPIVTELFQVKVWLKRKTAAIEINRQIAELQRKAEAYAPEYPAIVTYQPESGNMAELSIYDHHFAALIWGKETGWDDWDLRISDQSFRDAVLSLLSRAKGYGVDKILLSLGNDLQNSDNRAGTTEAGTMQSSDGRYEKVCGVVQDAAVWAIEQCLAVAPEVIVPMIRGNHDPVTTFHLGGYLKAWFRNCPSVMIDNSPLPRKAYQHGTVMLMLTHGNHVRTDEFPLLMAVEYPQMWAATTWHETHTGHIHTRRNMIPQLDEIKGVGVRSMPSLRPPCAWTSERGWVGNMRSAEAMFWNKEAGLIGTAVYSEPSRRAA